MFFPGLIVADRLLDKRRIHDASSMQASIPAGGGLLDHKFQGRQERPRIAIAIGYQSLSRRLGSS